MAPEPGDCMVHGLSNPQHETDQKASADDPPDEPFDQAAHHQQSRKHDSLRSPGGGRPRGAGGEVALPSSDWCDYQRGPNPIRGPIPIPIPGPKPRPGPNPGPKPGPAPAPKAGSCARCSGVRISATAVRAASAFSCI